MRVLITGATGFIGANLALALANRGMKVNALYRSQKKTEGIQHKNIFWYHGDILDQKSLKKAVEGCSGIYHVAAFTDVWIKDLKVIFELNVSGTVNVLETALESGIKDIVFTSTAGVFGPSIQGIINENTKRNVDFFLEYERTKAIAEEKARQYVLKGLNVRIVNPTRVYGPGLLSKSNSVTKMIRSYVQGKWRIIPGDGESIGNYVYIDDVVRGHILAMEKGNSGECYILGGDNVTYIHFFNTLKNITDKKYRMIRLPLSIMLFVANTVMFLNKYFGIKPFITPSLVKKFNYNWETSSEKAVRKLGYQITSIEEGMKKTIRWLK